MASVGNSRITIAIIVICSFAIIYTSLLLYSVYVPFIDIYFLDGIRDLTITLYLLCIFILSFTYKSNLEKEILMLGAVYFIAINLWRSLNHLQFFLLSTQWKLILINGFTIFYALVIYINAKKYDLITDNE